MTKDAYVSLVGCYVIVALSGHVLYNFMLSLSHDNQDPVVQN